MKKLNLVFVLFFLLSCGNVYKEHQKIDEMKWFRTDVKSFDVEIPDDGEYDLYFTMRHSTGYPFRNIGVNIVQITPDGKELSKEANFLIVDENDEYKGDVIGQLWDIQELFSEKTELKAGNYTFKIGHIMNSDPVILIIDVGLTIKKSGL
jgi:gliding motility-associated lipoprotein GldH